MARFLLVHGASHGAWCWNRVVPLLETHGHSAIAIDLPSHGDDPTPASDVTMDDYVQATKAAMTEETILVGHSLGGLSITLAAATKPAKSLVYLCALVPRPGQAFSDFRSQAISPAVGQTQTVDRETGVAYIKTELAGDVFYSDCSEEDRAFALANLSPQPIGLMSETLNFEMPDCPRHYIRCLHDKVVYPDYQRSVSASWQHVYDMATGHSPFFSDPQGLVAILDQIASD